MREMLITGGAGFIGCNAASHFARHGWNVTVLDNMSRAGADLNLEWLRHRYNVGFIKADIRDADALNAAFAQRPYEAVLHLAAQVAVTTSVADPRLDFDINALGSLNVLEAMRAKAPGACFIYSSTNKVYGALSELGVVEGEKRYAYANGITAVDESRPLDFHSPYGCSKGSAEQYALDYSRIYGLKTVSFRQSCIYGPRQFGIEDQGWLAWFVIARLLGKPITIFGNGKQVRDVLHVDDLLAAYATAIEQVGKVAGMAFNLGGGPQSSLSLIELIEHLDRRLGAGDPPLRGDWRHGDQRIYISDTGKFSRLTGWAPTVTVAAGVDALIDWAIANRADLERALAGQRSSARGP